MSPRVVVAGLGPAGADLVTAETRDLIGRRPHRWLRTGRHPAAEVAAPAATFDHLYEEAERLVDVYPAIVDELVAAADEHGEILYLVPGSPVVGEQTVELLRSRPGVDVDIRPALSFLDLAWARLGVDPVATGVRIVDGHRFAVEAAGVETAMLVGQCDSVEVLSDIKLAVDLEKPPDVTVLQGLGTGDEALTTVAWADLDRAIRPDHLTSLWIPALAPPVAGELQRFADLVATLRRECPWDRRQTHQSLTRHLVEESYEVLEAIDRLQHEPGPGYVDLQEELGDLLFQVFFHARLAAEAGEFTVADVASGIHDKLVRRHPHVFAEIEVDGADDVVTNWEAIKKQEKGRASVFDGIPRGLPALLRSLKVVRKAERAGLGDHLTTSVSDDELRAFLDHPEPESTGAILLALVERAGAGDIDPEEALRRATDRIEDELRSQESGTLPH